MTHFMRRRKRLNNQFIELNILLKTRRRRQKLKRKIEFLVDETKMSQMIK